ncbi:cell wall protein IFF6-like protein [Carex littledalei]|uniref:Cell wall protein IFF6-like protein n=1 Tax=Carex littledalei TaxID=544730 RepID=A0A833VGM1_9POAL|nr:cell wall protein IFF6-like protein [Carex littledalei]
MTAPNIEMIASSLRNCSLNYQNTPASPSSSSSSTSSSYQTNYAAAPPPPTPSMTGDFTVELNSDVALPFQWEQCLDLRNGQVYYINWEDGTRTTVDPRAHNRSFYLYNSSSDDEDPVTDPEEAEGEAETALGAQETYIYDSSSDTDSCSGINTESSYTSNISSNPSSFSPTESSSSGGFGAFSGASDGGTANGGAVLVAAGCKACFMYFMVPKHVNVCPKCGGAGLLHLGRA